MIARWSEDPAVDYVIDDGAAGARMAVEHLVTLGHQRIAHISGTGEEGPSRASTQTDSVRCEGYKNAMRQLCLEHFIRVVPGPYTEEGGYRAARELLLDQPHPIDATAAPITAVTAPTPPTLPSAPTSASAPANESPCR